MERSTLDLWVGLFVAAGIAALLVLSLKVSNTSGFNVSKSYQLTANFDNIGGLKPQAPIKSAGVVVGRVTGIQFDNDKYAAKVTLNIDDRYKFPQDSVAEVLTSGLLGEQYIGLEAGIDDAMFKNGDTVRSTQSAVVLEKLISQFMYNKAADGGTSK